jgi:hypothetical protein
MDSEMALHSEMELDSERALDSAMAPDSIEVVPDSVEVVPDSVDVVSDSVDVMPDSVDVMPDSIESPCARCGTFHAGGVFGEACSKLAAKLAGVHVAVLFMVTMISQLGCLIR